VKSILCFGSKDSPAIKALTEKDFEEPRPPVITK
jgi:hypothetical protein